ncbi:MAG: APC family permease [Actinobacteria bacterium]|nr:APC family permease [Actinomycetota bacterium]
MALSERAKRLFLGRAIRSERIDETLLPKRIALPVFASDALSSNAYATQEMLVVLALGGASLFAYGPWIALLIVIVFVIVVSSYRQNVRAYPNGGGDYTVVSENIGQRAGVMVASALFVDYVLTVAVSAAAAVANLGSVLPFFAEHSILFSLLLVAVLVLFNLRGIRESGVLFAVPAYLFMGSIGVMFITAVIKLALGEEMRAESADWEIQQTAQFAGFALVLLLARAYSSGTTALTGVEAISNGVPAFRKPQSRNAATTLALLAVISMSMFMAITWLALKTQVKVTDNDADLIGLPPGQPQKTVVVQIAEAVFSNTPVMVLVISVATAAILAVAANTAFNAFPVLGSILARDGYLPRQLHTRGDRLAFSNGILTLAVAAGLLIAVFDADVTALIQLYIIGVFFSFTLTQIGMVRYWARQLRSEPDQRRRRSMRRSQLINRIGAILCGFVFVVVLVSKFARGAWIVVLAVPILYLVMRAINAHYERVKIELAPDAGDERTTLPSRVFALVLVSKIHKPTLRAVAYARGSRPAVLEAITVNVDPEETARLTEEWQRRDIPVPLRILDSPYREITRPVIDYVRQLRRQSPRDLVAIYVPQYVVGHWWEQLLHNQSALRLRARLMFSQNVVVVTVPWQLDSALDRASQQELPGPGAFRRGEDPPPEQKQGGSLE